MIFFYLAYWWFTRGRPFKYRLAIGLSVETLRGIVALGVNPPEGAMAQPAIIVLSFAFHLAAVSAFLGLMHFSGKVMKARKARRAMLRDDASKEVGTEQPEPDEQLSRTPSPSCAPSSSIRTTQRKAGGKIALPTALLSSVAGLFAALALFLPSTLELYDETQRAAAELDSELDAYSDAQWREPWRAEYCSAVIQGRADALELVEERVEGYEIEGVGTDSSFEVDPAMQAVNQIIEQRVAEIGKCRGVLSEADFADFRQSMRISKLPTLDEYLEEDAYSFLMDRLHLNRGLRAMCPLGFGEINCSSLLPNFTLHQWCHADNSRASDCRERRDAVEAKVLSVFECEHAVDLAYYGEGFDQIAEFEEFAEHCIEPRSRLEDASEWEVQSQRLLHRHIKFSGLVAGLVSAVFALMGLIIVVAIKAYRQHMEGNASARSD
jgi:hypothetical protein